jgi:hypothetical protein
MNTFARVAACTRALVSITWSSRGDADHPAVCKPAAGATAECTKVLTTPYTYNNPGCGQMPNFDNPSAAMAAWVALHEDFYNACPGSIFEPQGWIPSSAPMCSGNCGPGTYATFSFGCAGGSGWSPSFFASGDEWSNWSIFRVGGQHNAPTCNLNRDPYFVGQTK